MMVDEGPQTQSAPCLTCGGRGWNWYRVADVAEQAGNDGGRAATLPEQRTCHVCGGSGWYVWTEAVT
jgi:hypothetical protein